MTKSKKILFITILALLALGLGACSGRRIVAAGWSGVTVDEETVYFSYGPQAYAISLKNGSQQWQYPAEPINGVDFYAAPVISEDREQLILASYKNEIHSINPDNGMKNWSYSVPSDNRSAVRFIDSPLITEEGIFAPASNNTLYALDLDGVFQWKFQTEDPLWASPVWSENCECIYQVSMDHHLYALDGDSGKLLWKSEDLGGPMVSPPAISETGLIIVSTFNNEIIALDGNSQDVVWRFTTNDWAWASPLIDGEQVYVSDIGNDDNPGTFYALEMATGDILWQIQPGGGIYDAPLVQGELIYFSTDASSLVVVNQDGVVQRNQPFEGKLYTGPISGGEKLLLALSESEYYLIALNQSGVQVWGYPPAD
jgi:outer membrane protein assembly factor BamB